MTALPHMPMFWERFFADTELMSAEARGLYALLLGRMWLNQGWLPADDQRLARMLGLDPRTWRATYKTEIMPYFTVETDEIVGSILRQKRLTSVLSNTRDLVAKRQAQTARAREEKAAKTKQRPSVTERANGSATKSVTEPATDTVTKGYARASPEPENHLHNGEAGSGAPLPPPQQQASPPPAMRATAPPPAAALTGPFVPAKTSDWDRPAAPGPKSEFLRAFEKAQAGDPSELEKLKARRADLPVNSTITPPIPVAAKPQEEHHGRGYEPEHPDDDTSGFKF